jgi:hypothetical protein
LLQTVSNCRLSSGVEPSGSETRVFISLGLALVESEQIGRDCLFVVYLMTLSATRDIIE